MAVVESIPEKVQTPSAQKGVLDYCMQPSKTFDEGEQLAYISGYNCIPEMANESFLATQKLFGHAAGGVRFYHFVQSFMPGENISPQEVNEIGMELVKSFGNREAIIATHIDREHLHNHIVVCAYDLADGRKLHYNKFFLADLRRASDEICQAHGLKILREYDPKVKSQRMKPKEYRAALNGNSMKLALCATIDFCMTRAKTQAQFREEMKKYGYEMVWTSERKYITYILRGRDGTEKRVRDKSLFDEKYRKENMEHEFRIREELYGQAQGEKYSATGSGGNADGRRNTDGSNQRRGVGRTDRLEELSVELKAQKAAFAAEAGKYAEQITRAIQAQNEATAAAIRKISEEASEQVGKASEKASKVIYKRSIRDDALWWLRMAYAAVPMILTLLLWAYVGLKA